MDKTITRAASAPVELSQADLLIVSGGFNPQPDPPGLHEELNPQPLPPRQL
jgi:hypothetical protein